MHALYVIVPVLCILAIAYRYYSAFIAAKVMVARRHARDAGAHEIRRRELLPDEPLGAVRPSLRGDYRRRPAASARCSPRSSATRPGSSGSSPACCLAGAVHDYIALWASTRRGGRSLADIARTEISPVAGITAMHRDPLHHRHRARRPRHRRRQRARRERVGHVHDRRHDPARHLHGLLHVQVAEGADQGGDDHRRLDHDGRRHSRQAVRQLTARATTSSSRRTRSRSRCAVYGVRGVGDAGVDAADAARVPQHVHEDRDDPRSSCSA